MQPSTIADNWADNMSEIRYCIWVAVKRAFDQWQQTVPITVEYVEFLALRDSLRIHDCVFSDNWEATRPKIVARAMDQLVRTPSELTMFTPLGQRLISSSSLNSPASAGVDRLTARMSPS